MIGLGSDKNLTRWALSAYTGKLIQKRNWPFSEGDKFTNLNFYSSFLSAEEAIAITGGDRCKTNQYSKTQDFMRVLYDAMKFVYIRPISSGPGRVKKENTFNRSKAFRASSHFAGVDKQAPTWPGRTSSSLWLERWDGNLILIKPLDWIDIYLNLGKHLHIWGWAWRSL